MYVMFSLQGVGMMDSDTFVLLEALLIIGAVLGFGVYQLMAVRRLMKKDRAHVEAADTGSDDADR